MVTRVVTHADNGEKNLVYGNQYCTQCYCDLILRMECFLMNSQALFITASLHGIAHDGSTFKRSLTAFIGIEKKQNGRTAEQQNEITLQKTCS